VVSALGTIPVDRPVFDLPLSGRRLGQPTSYSPEDLGQSEARPIPYIYSSIGPYRIFMRRLLFFVDDRLLCWRMS